MLVSKMYLDNTAETKVYSFIIPPSRDVTVPSNKSPRSRGLMTKPRVCKQEMNLALRSAPWSERVREDGEIERKKEGGDVPLKGMRCAID